MDPADQPDTEDEKVLRAKLNMETSRISWLELQRYYARGQVVGVSPQLNLMDVAIALYRDDKKQFEAWMQSGELGEVVPAQAQQWYDNGTEVWALVVAPWVLVQDSVDQDAAARGNA